MVYLNLTLMGDLSAAIELNYNCSVADVIEECSVVVYQGAKRNSGDSQSKTIPSGEPSQAIKSQADKNTEKVSCPISYFKTNHLATGPPPFPASFLWITQQPDGTKAFGRAIGLVLHSTYLTFFS